MGETKKRISVYVRNHIDGPSCFYRIIQYMKHMEEVEFEINDALSIKDFRRNMDIKNRVIKKIFQVYLFFKISLIRFLQVRNDSKKRTEIVIIQREVFPRHIPFFCKKIYKKMLSNSMVIWDYDDAITLSGEISEVEWHMLENFSQYIIATNSYLLDRLKTNAKKLELPTTDGYCDDVDLEKIKANRLNRYSHEINLVWVGTHSNLNNVIKILPQLKKAGKILKMKGKKLKLEVVCNVDNPGLYVVDKNLDVKFTKWKRQSAEKAILDAHIGLMPIPNNEFTKGKGGFKLVQYIASGLPVIASAVGFNKEIVSKDVGTLTECVDDWYSAIIDFSLDEEKWIQMSLNARLRYFERFSFKRNLDVWRNIIFQRE